MVEINYLSCIVGVVSCRRSMSILGEIVAKQSLKDCKNL